LTKKKEVKEQEGKERKKREECILTYFTCLERNGEIVAVFVIVVRRFDIRLCSGVRIIRVIIKEKVYVRSNSRLEEPNPILTTAKPEKP